MQVTIELPEDIAEAIRETAGDVGRRVLEAFAAEGVSNESRSFSGIHA
jgi:hypothetical protein